MKLRKLFMALCGLSFMSLAACTGSETTIQYSQLPADAQTFLNTHFAGQQVKMVKADKDDAVPEYDVLYNNGTKVEFDSVSGWKEISNPTEAVPVTMLPDTTQTYISTNYPNEKVIKVEKDSKGYEVKFANGVELEFDRQGVFYKVDR